ncbi:uncharacterized protein METZ01_LOCUS489764, partial [marine metagenome]
STKNFFPFFFDLLGTILCLFSFSFLVYWVYDLSWDGQAYHIPIFLRIADGWNYFSQGPDHYFTNYTRGVWIADGLVYSLTGLMESAKIWVFALIPAAILWVNLIIKDCYSTFWRILFLLAVGISPIVIVQSFTFLVDGILYLWEVLLLCSLMQFYRKNSKASVAMVLVATSGLISTKLSGLFYAGFMHLAFLLWVMIQKKPLVSFKKSFFLSFASIAAAFFLVCASPYVMNTYKHLNP